MKTDWNHLLKEEFGKPYWKDLQHFVSNERTQYEIFPQEKDILSAFHLTPHRNVKVLILGQDPYHREGQAHGLCFSVKHGMKTPPSLQNIFQELNVDIGVEIPDHGNLEKWARQGVLLLNATLTVRAGQAGSHQGKGWETFTDHVIEKVNEKTEKVVFILWGAFARRKKELIDLDRHCVIESPHPSPLSAYRGFFGSKPFSRVNTALQIAGRDPVDWRL